MGFLTNEQIENLGFKKVGQNVRISDKASIYGASNIEIDDDSRIDDFCILSAGIGGIKIGKFVHIAAYVSLIGKELIELKDFSGLSSKVAIYSSSDDYSGAFLTNPCVPEEYTNVIHGKVILEKHVIVGVGSAILPNVTIGMGAAVGAFSLITKNVEPLQLVSGVPAKFIKPRLNNFLELEKQFLESRSKNSV